ncbi:MAG: phosphatase PAP2 family protein [Bacteroidota bacterium]
MNKNAKKKVIYLALFMVMLVGVVVFLFPVSFSAYRANHVLADFWLTITNTGVAKGSILLTVFGGLILAISHITLKKGLFVFFVFTISTLLTIKLASDFNEVVLKRSIGHARPSIVYLENMGIVKADSVYSRQQLEERSNYVRSMASVKKEETAYFNQNVLEHWIHSTGHSFPSGHAQNAFLLGSILSFVLLGSRFQLTKSLYFLPLIWASLIAVSRVTLGVHRPVDVTIGALIGSIEAILIFQIPLLKSLFQPRDFGE